MSDIQKFILADDHTPPLVFMGEHLRKLASPHVVFNGKRRNYEYNIYTMENGDYAVLVTGISGADSEDDRKSVYQLDYSLHMTGGGLEPSRNYRAWSVTKPGEIGSGTINGSFKGHGRLLAFLATLEIDDTQTVEV